MSKKLVEIQFTSWDKVYNFDPEEHSLEVGNYVVVETELGTELGKVVGFAEFSEEDLKKFKKEIKPILRKATQEDLDIALKKARQKEKSLKECRVLIKKHNLPMKLVDVHFSFDDTRVTFAFIADGRIDFRELVKDLNKKFKKIIRLQQIGIRDEMKLTGDIGSCGRHLCCQKFLTELGNVTSDLAELQQVAHRGSERLSGVCGRLKCCLKYEKEVYEDLADKMPLIGDEINTSSGRGEVIGWHILKQSVDVLLDDGETIIEVPISK